MLDWKVFAAAIVTLLALLATLGSHPAVKDFFASVGGGLPALGGEEFAAGNVSFSLASEKESLAVQTIRPVNITVDAVLFHGTVKEASLNVTSKQVRIRNYKGSLSVAGNSLQLNGSLHSFEFDGVFIVRGEVDASASYDKAEIEGLALRELSLNSSGVLVADGSEVKFEQLRIENLLGTFTYTDKLAAQGVAKKITAGRIVIE
ncbi:MAG: hypothetical protein HY368_01045 [Candidatus Aenigmarchaeota archaeon]|nr:hypothetical protein [Candidatus Aenigmarchaeota archaeon]